METSTTLNKDIMKTSIIDPDLECSICNDILFRPVSINCGHSFCRECLATTLKVKPQCPICRTPCFLQANGLKENVTVRSVIENKYPDYVNKREEKLLLETRKQETLPQSTTTATINPTIILPMTRDVSATKVIFPGDSFIIAVRIKFDPNIIQNVCNDKKFLAIPESIIQSKTKHKTFIMEFVNIRQVPNRTDLYTIRVRARERVCIESYTDLKIEPQVLQEWGHPADAQNVEFKVGNGHLIQDNNLASNEQIEEQVVFVEKYFNKKIGEWMHSNPKTYKQVFEQLKPILNQSTNRSMEYFVNFSFVAAKFIKAPSEIKKQMAETTNTYQRLALLKKTIEQFPSDVDYKGVFDIPIPENEMNLKQSLMLLVGVILILLLISFKKDMK